MRDGTLFLKALFRMTLFRMTSTKGTPVKLGFIAATALAMFALTACGSAGKADVPKDQALKPAVGKSAWATTEVSGVTISVPKSWQRTGPVAQGVGGELFMFQTEENSFGTRGGAQLLTIDKREKKAVDLVTNVTSEAQAVAGAKKITTTHVVWPGAEDAWLVTYVAYPPSNGKVAAHPTEVLLLDLPKGAQAQATVTALEEDFGPQNMHAVLGTVTVTDKVGSKES